MAILTTGFTGEVGIHPSLPRLFAPLDSLETITSSGYVNKIQGGSGSLNISDVVVVYYNGGRGLFYPTFSGAIVTLNSLDSDIQTNYQKFVGISNIAAVSGGVWTPTRLNGGNYALVHTVDEDESIIGIDITEEIELASNKGFMLESIDVIYGISEDDLEGHAFGLFQTTYADQVAPDLNIIDVDPELSLDQDLFPYVTNIEIPNPEFLNTACSKYVAEVQVSCSATGEYAFYGLNLHFTKTL